MVEQAEPVSRTRGTARRQSPETDDRNPAKFQKKLDALDKSMSAKRSTFEEAEEAVKAAQREYSTFSEKILKEVQDILKDCHAEGQEWTATAVRRQVDRFRRLGEVVRDALVPDLLVPLEEASETRSALEMAYIERAELTRKLEEAKRRS
jgi:dsDNA-specific endonuclease/ATPase MutS2